MLHIALYNTNRVVQVKIYTGHQSYYGYIHVSYLTFIIINCLEDSILRLYSKLITQIKAHVVIVYIKTAIRLYRQHNSMTVPGEFPTQRPVTRSFDVFFDVRPNKQLSKQSWGWWFETLSPSLWRHRNAKRWWGSGSQKCTSNGSWCIGIKGEMSGTVCVTFTWDIYIYMSCL